MDIFKIVLPGSNVHQAKLEEEVLDSQYPSPKISMLANPPHAGIIFLNWASTGIIIARGTVRVLYSFPHGYNYIPSTFASYRFDNGSIISAGVLPFQIGALGMIIIDADDKNINLKYYSLDLGSVAIPAFLMRLRFYVMAERGHE